MRLRPDQISAKIKGNLKGILLFCSISTVLILAFIAYDQREESLEKKAQAVLYEFKESLTLLEEKLENKNSAQKTLDSDSATPDENIQQKLRDQAQAYEEALRQKQRHKISVAFAIDLADFYNRQGDSHKAIKLLLLFALPKKSSSLYQMASFQLASYYMDRGECAKALPLLSALTLNKKAQPLHLESRLQEALCLENMNRYDEALARYTDLAQEDPEGYMGRKAQDYKNLLLLNRRLKEEK